MNIERLRRVGAFWILERVRHRRGEWFCARDEFKRACDTGAPNPPDCASFGARGGHCLKTIAQHRSLDDLDDWIEPEMGGDVGDHLLDILNHD